MACNGPPCATKKDLEDLQRQVTNLRKRLKITSDFLEETGEALATNLNITTKQGGRIVVLTVVAIFGMITHIALLILVLVALTQ